MGLPSSGSARGSRLCALFYQRRSGRHRRSQAARSRATFRLGGYALLHAPSVARQPPRPSGRRPGRGRARARPRPLPRGRTDRRAGDRARAGTRPRDDAPLVQDTGAPARRGDGRGSARNGWRCCERASAAHGAQALLDSFDALQPRARGLRGAAHAARLRARARAARADLEQGVVQPRMVAAVEGLIEAEMRSGSSPLSRRICSPTRSCDWPRRSSISDAVAGVSRDTERLRRIEAALLGWTRREPCDRAAGPARDGGRGTARIEHLSLSADLTRIGRQQRQGMPGPRRNKQRGSGMREKVKRGVRRATLRAGVRWRR